MNKLNVVEECIEKILKEKKLDEYQIEKAIINDEDVSYEIYISESDWKDKYKEKQAEIEKIFSDNKVEFAKDVYDNQITLRINIKKCLNQK